jgi:Protein of unknown function (DUF4012)
MKWTLISGFLLLLVVVGMAAWIGVHAVEAGRHLNRLRGDVDRVHDDLVAGQNADADLQTARRDATAANHETHDPVWAAASWLPPVHTIRGLSSVANNLATNVLTPVVAVAPSVEPSKLRVTPDKIALSPLQDAAPTLARAAAAANAARAELAALPSGWFGILSAARAKALRQVTSLGGTVDDSARFAAVGPTMLGGNGLRRYFVAVQDNAETRATGGFVASYAIVTTDHGVVKVASRGIDSQLVNSPRPVVDLGKDYDAEYGLYHPTQEWRASNLSPNFPYAADIWAHLWEAQGGGHIDGVIGVDPVVLGDLLKVVGPVTVPGYPETFTGANLATFIESTEYSAFQNKNGLRKPFVSKVAAAVLDRLLSGTGSPTQIVTALGQAAGESHLQVWSAHPLEEAQIVGTPLAGALPQSHAPFVALALNNVTGSKLDYYVERSVTYAGSSCGSGGRRETTATVRLLNTAPRTGLPRYVRIRDDETEGYEAVPNERLGVWVYATAGALLDNTTLNGTQIDTIAGTDDGHPAFEYDVTLPPGVPQTLVLHLDEPVSPGAPTTKLQPLFHPQQTTFDLRRCG